MPITLRLLVASDYTTLARIANDISIWQNVQDSFPHPYTEDHAKAFIEKATSSDKMFIRAIIQDNELVGMIGLHPKEDIYSHSYEMGYWVGKPYRSKGVAAKAVEKMLHFGFQEQKIKRIYASVYAHNKASIRVLEKNDFQHEGIGKLAVSKDGKLIDEVRLGILHPSLR